MRVYELAKILGKSNKDLMKILEDLGIKVKTHMSSIENNVAQLVEDALTERPSTGDAKGVDAPEKTKIVLGENVTIKTVAEKIGVTSANIVKALMSAGIIIPATSVADEKVLEVISGSFDVTFDVVAEPPKPAPVKPEPAKPKDKSKAKKEPSVKKAAEEDRELTMRPPIVTVMGHVDHGKTTLLDAIRNTNVTANEAGGITQHIGAYVVTHDQKSIVFLDTPGHEAFTAMRARGASVTDIVILVVAADDGVMPQTREAIDHIKAAGVPIVVAVNKIDKPGAKPDRARQQLSDIGLVPEEWGGDVVMVDISAKAGEGIDRLLEMVLLVAEMQELKGDVKASPRGVVIEAELDRGRGPVATIIVQQGTLKRGDIVLFGTAWGKVRALIDSTGKNVFQAGPSTPVELLGLVDVPQPGETFTVVSSEREARSVVSENIARERDAGGASVRRASLEDLYSQLQEGRVPQLNLLVKCDVQGSVEALCASLEKMATAEVGVTIVHKGVGRIAESDVTLASASNAVIIGFNVRPDANAKRLFESEGVEARFYNVIYDAIDDVKAAMGGLLKPNLREQRQGEVEIREIFSTPKGKVAGCHVMQGFVRRSSRVRLVRAGVVIWSGGISTLRHFKDEAREIKAGFDCGIALAGFQDFAEGDVLETYEIIEEKRTL